MPTEDQAIQVMIDKLREEIPDVDFEKGPIRDLFITPVAREEILLINQMDRVARLYSVDFYESMTREELESLAYQFGVTPFQGSKARGTISVHVVQNTTDRALLVPTGSAFSTDDGQYSYISTESIEIPRDTLNNYYNSETKTYVIDVSVEAADVGEDYNIAAFRIVQITARTNFQIKRVENRSALIGGRSPESNAELAERIREVSVKNERGTISGFNSAILDAAAGKIYDISLVRNDEIDGYRNTYRAHIDAFVIGSESTEVSESFIAAVSESGQQFKLSNTPVSEVTAVTVGTTEITETEYTVTLDPTPYSGSNDVVQIKGLVSVGTEIQITYVYNKVLQDLQQEFDVEENDVFGVSLRFREAVPIALQVIVQATIQISQSSVSFAADVQQFTQAFINQNKFVTQLNASDLREYLRNNITGILSLSISHFGKVSEQESFDILTFEANEYPVIESDQIEIV